MTYEVNVDAILDALVVILKTISNFSNRVYKHDFDDTFKGNPQFPACIINLVKDTVTPAVTHQWHHLSLLITVFEGIGPEQKNLPAIVKLVTDMLDTVKANPPIWTECKTLKENIEYGIVEMQKTKFYAGLIPTTISRKW